MVRRRGGDWPVLGLFDPYVQQFKSLGFDVDTFYDRDAQSVLNAAQLRTKEEMLQGIFVVGHGSPTGFGTGGGWFDSDVQQVWIDYSKLSPNVRDKRSGYPLGLLRRRQWRSEPFIRIGECVFDGVDRTLYPFYDYTSFSTLFANGKQGTKTCVNGIGPARGTRSFGTGRPDQMPQHRIVGRCIVVGLGVIARGVCVLLGSWE